MDSVDNKHIIDAAIALDLSFLVPSLLSKLPPSVDIKQLLEEYKKFLVIKVVAKDTQCSPSALIDQVWHEHILNTAKYRDACTAFGVFIDHDPSGAQDKDDKRGKRLLLTKTHYSLIFNVTPPLKFWELRFGQDSIISSDDGGCDLKDNKDLKLKINRKRVHEARSIKIKVKMLTGKTLFMDVDLSDSIKSLKMEIWVNW